MILGLRTVVVYVRTEQLEEAKKWYAAVVGVAPYYDTPYYVGFNVGGFELGIHPEGTPGPGGVCAYWGTADVAAESEAPPRSRREARQRCAGCGRGDQGRYRLRSIRQPLWGDRKPPL